MVNFKQLILNSLPFFIGGAGVFGALFYEEIGFVKAKNMIIDDKKKIVAALKYDVYYDYESTNFSIDSTKLDSILYNLRNSEDYDVEFLYLKYGFKESVPNKFYNFTMAISALDKDKKEIKEISDFPLNGWDSKDFSIYKKAYKKLKAAGLIGAYGHRDNVFGGVIFPLDSAIAYIKEKRAEKYFLYPSFMIEESLFSPNFTTVIVSNDSLLRKKAFSPEGISKKDNNFYGDKGTTCCQ
ncbi:hypothetical protein [Lacihabitans lacunae]|uniref:Uncharacterized protein n=1 Tax=Lacihabitans lacunae TaxID=1028214 RepID=A0ABV7YY84_9BACT